MGLLKFMEDNPVLTFFLLWLTYEFLDGIVKTLKGDEVKE